MNRFAKLCQLQGRACFALMLLLLLSTSLPAQTTYYTFNTAATQDWSDANRWTTDPGGAGFPGQGVPAGGPGGGAGGSASDRIVIRAGAQVNVSFDNLDVDEIELQKNAELNLQTTSGHNLGTVKGQGVLRLEPTTATGDYELPGGGWSNFFSSNGGTVEFSGGSGELFEQSYQEDVQVSINSANSLTTQTGYRTFNNVIFSGSGAKIIPSERYKFNGDVRIQGSASIQLKASYRFRVLGDFINESSAPVAFDVSNLTNTADYDNLSTAQFFLKGDMINKGNGSPASELHFTQKTSQSNATANSSTVIFDNHFADQQLICNGPIRFECVVINKGTDQTYELAITADAPNQFQLYGRVNGNPGSGADNNNPKALALNSGTVSLGSNVYALLSNSSNYNVNEDARLLVNGGTAEQTGGPATVPYGTIQVANGGTFIADVTSGITIRASGVILVEDGLLEARQIRTSILSGPHLGAYIQSGGTTHLTGGSPGQNRARFSLPYSTNIFQMSGGTLRIDSENLSNSRGFDVRSNSSSFSITGGTVEANLSSSSEDFKLNASVPVYNLHVTGAAADFELGAISEPSGGGFAPVQDEPLVAFNNVTVDDNIDFLGNSNNITIGRNLTLGSNASFQPGTQTTTFNKANFAELRLEDASQNYNLEFDTLVVDKPGVSLSFVSPGRTDDPTDPLSRFVTVDDSLRLTNGRIAYGGYRLRLRGGAFLKGDVGQISSNGRLEIEDGNTHTLKAGFNAKPTIGHFEIANGSTVNLVGDDLGEIGTLTMPSATGIFDIGPHRVPVRLALNNGGNAWGLNKSIRMDGKFSDRGLGRYLDANGSYLYPISTDANGTPRYTPVTATISGFPGADAGYLDFSLVDQEHPSLNNAAPANSAITYFFRARTSGFSGTKPEVSYTFDYANSDEPASPGSPLSNWVPGKIVNANRAFEDDPDYQPGSDQIIFDATSGTFPVEEGDYTAGDPTNFNGGVEVFYSRYNQPGQTKACCGVGVAWNEHTTWSKGAHNGAPVSPGTYPEQGDIVYIAPGHRVYAGNTTGGDPFNSADTPIYASVVHLGGFLFFRGDNALGGSVIQEIRDTTGTGQLYFEPDGNSPSQLPQTDIGDYSANSDNLVIYRWAQNAASGEFDIPNNFRTYPNLRFMGAGGGFIGQLWDGNNTPERRVFNLPAVDITVNGLMNVQTGAIVNLNTSQPNQGDLLVRKNLRIGDGRANHGMLQFPNSGNPRTLDINGHLNIRHARSASEPSGIRTEAGGPGLVHTLKLQGDLNLAPNDTSKTSDAVVDFNGSTKVHLILDGDTSATYRRQSTNGINTLPNFYRVTIDKDAGLADTFTFDHDFNIDAALADANASEDKNFVIKRGIAKLNHTAIDVTLSSGGADYRIPKTGGLVLDNGATARLDVLPGQASDLKLVGSLRLANTNGVSPRTEMVLASADAAESTDIIYSPTASASVSVLDDAYLNIGGQLRREAIPPVGGLSYTQSGNSLVQIGEEINSGQPNTYITNRGVFDLVGGAGSSFTMSGGRLQIMNEVPNASVAEVLLQSGSFSMTGGTIQLGRSSGMGSGQQISVNASLGNALHNLEVVDAGTNLTGEVAVNPLEINNDLSILGSSSTFSPKNLDVFIRGDFLNEGSYDATDNTTIFDGNGNQNITLDASTDFASLEVDKSGGQVDLGGSQSGTIVQDQLFVMNGMLDLTSKRMEVRGDVTNEAEVINSAGGVLELNNSSGQVQTLFGDGSGQYGNLELDNPDNALLDENARINGTLTFTQGRLVASFHELIFGPTAGVSNYNNSRYIQTDGTNAAAGVTKIINSTGSFTLPVGNLKRFGPATYNVTGLTSNGRLTVKPINGPPSEYTDPANQWGVNFHWVVETSSGLNITGLTHDYTYADADLQTPAEETDGDGTWTAGYLYDGASSWVTSNTVNVNKTTNVAEFDNTSNIEAIYAVGETSELDVIQEFWSISPGGDYDDPNTWSTVPWTDAAFPDNPSNRTPDPETAPTGGAGTAHIKSGHTVTVMRDNAEAFVMDIQAGGELDVQGNVGAKFRDVVGGGRVIMRPAGANANLPNSDWSDFISADGTLEFSGNNNYKLPKPAQIDPMPNVELNGTGRRTVAVAGTEIQETLLLNGPELDLDSKRLRLAGDFTFTGGTITPNNGPLELIGATDQTFDGNFTPAANAALADLELDKSGGDLALASGTTIEVQGALDWQQPALIQTGAMSTFRFGPSATYTGAGANSYINGPAEREIFNGAEFTFPIGKNGEYRRARAFNISGVSGNEFLAAEYYTATIDGSLEDPIYDVEKNAHWRFEANSGIESRFELFWQNPVAGYDAPAHVAKTAAVGPSQNVEDMGGNEPAGSNTDGTGQVKSVQSHTFASPIYVAVGYEINPLPVELLSFEGELVEGATQLGWQTTREVNSLLFEVQRSTSPSQGFQSLGAIEAAGNSSTLQDYSYLDRDPPNAPVLYYRLKQVDLDGSAEFSKVVAVRPSNTLPNDAPLWQVGPNPTNGRNLQINGLHKEAHQTTARLISADGRVLFRSSGELPQVEARLAQRLNELPAAPYMLHLSAAGRHQHFRIVKY